MPFCPFCRAEYRSGFTHCADCQVELVDELPPLEPEPRGHPVKEVPVAVFMTQTEAEMWAEVLRKEGIPAVLVPLGPGAGAWGNSVWIPHQLRVRETDEERARNILPDTGV